MSLRRTLEENAFGPFDANEVLDEYVTHKKNSPVELHHLEVTRNGRPSGLDDAEPSISEEPVGKVKYFGTLCIEDLSWISPVGRRLIQEDMKRRGINLTLESIYGPDRPSEGLTVKIGIAVERFGLTYLTDKNHPNEMFLFSLTTGMSMRRLRIATLHPVCFVKSTKYIATYRFHRLFANLCSQMTKPTPEDFFNALVDQQTKAGTRVNKDTIIKTMAKHAMWMAKNAQRSVDVASWKEFANTEILDIDEDVDMDAPGYGRPVRRILSSSVSPPLSQKRRRSQSANSRSSLDYTSDDQLFERKSELASSPDRSPSPPFANPYVATRVPVSFSLVPQIPDDFHWWCEIKGCRYNIDLLNLTTENLRMLNGETVAKLRLQDWSLSDPWVRFAFKVMVEDHRVKHLESWGLRCTEGPSGALAHIELAEPPEPDGEKDKLSDIKIEFLNLL